MKTIYKYPLAITDTQVLPMPIGAEILCVQIQGLDSLQLWALVDTKRQAIEVRRTIRIFGTGREIENHNLSYIDTFQLDRGELVFHVFEEPA